MMDLLENCLAFGHRRLSHGCEIEFCRIPLEGFEYLGSTGEAFVTRAIGAQIPEEAFDRVHPLRGCWRVLQDDLIFVAKVVPFDQQSHLSVVVYRTVVPLEMARQNRRCLLVVLFS